MYLKSFYNIHKYVQQNYEYGKGTHLRATAHHKCSVSPGPADDEGEECCSEENEDLEAHSNNENIYSDAFN